MNRSLSISALLEDEAHDLQLRLLAGEDGLRAVVNNQRIQKPGLALTGYVDFIRPKRVQIFGGTELDFLKTLEDDEQRRIAIDRFCAVQPACVICTKGLLVPDVLIASCEAHGVALLQTPQQSSVFIARIENWLEDRLAPRTVLHAVLVEVFGVGVLLLGKSGIGKSEAALELIHRGHRLVADDAVSIHRRGAETIWGQGNRLLQHHIELRGLGILNIRDLYGVVAVRDRKRIDLVAELVMWSEDDEYDRLGLEERRFPILDVELPLITVPVRPGRNMGAIIEVAARNQLLKSMGTHSARDFQKRLDAELAPGRRASIDDVE